MTEGLTGSLSIVGRPGSDVPRVVQACELYLVMQGDDPMAPSLRIPLWTLDRVEFQRSPSADRAYDVADRTMTLALADRRMSSKHAYLTVSGDDRATVTVHDSGSKNGTYINGQKVAQAVLQDGDVLELGHSFFVFRGLAPCWADDELGPRILKAPELATFDAQLAQTYAAVADIAPTDMALLITGDSGTGKEILARAVHALSGRCGAFVVLDPGLLAERSVEQTLFGDLNADDATGLVDAAAEGTLFLDEVSDLPPAWQVALLRVLQDRQVVAPGPRPPRPVTFRPIATTHRSLDEEVEQGRFRFDLLSRIDGTRVHVKPLVERTQDIGLLIRSLLLRTPSAPKTLQFRRRSVLALLRHRWPYNVRELESTIRHCLARANGEPVALEHLPAVFHSGVGERSAGRPPPQVPVYGERVESVAASAEVATVAAEGLRVSMLGVLEVSAGGAPVSLPPSKKVRAMLAYLVATGRAHRRERLCTMFCELADQQRAALRWHLSKVRRVLNSGDIDRLLANREDVSVFSDALVSDYHDVHALVTEDLAQASLDRLERAAQRFRGDFLEGLTLPDCAQFEAWRVATAEECLSWRVRVLRAILRHADEAPARVLPHARDLFAIVPDDPRVGVQVEALKKTVRALKLGSA